MSADLPCRRLARLRSWCGSGITRCRAHDRRQVTKGQRADPRRCYFVSEEAPRQGVPARHRCLGSAVLVPMVGERRDRRRGQSSGTATSRRRSGEGDTGSRCGEGCEEQGGREGEPLGAAKLEARANSQADNPLRNTGHFRVNRPCLVGEPRFRVPSCARDHSWARGMDRVVQQLLLAARAGEEDRRRSGCRSKSSSLNLDRAAAQQRHGQEEVRP
jgi:hypothetical protein